MYTIKRIRLLTLLLACVMIISLCPQTALAYSGSTTLTIVHINDRHGRMDADAYIAQLVKDTKGHVLLLDAGDSLHGQTTANLSEGQTMVELMNAVGYDAMVPGNHDFNYGVKRLLELSDMMDFPLLAANVKRADGSLIFKPYEVLKIGGLKVGIFGIATPETLTKVSPAIVAGLQFTDPAVTAMNMVTVLQELECDIVIALVHLGVDAATEAKNKSRAVATVPGVDVVIDGHSHTAMSDPYWAGDTLIAQTGWAAENIGVVQITINNNTKSLTSYLIPAPFDSLKSDAAITKKIDELNARNEAITSQVVGNTPVFLQGAREYLRKEETNLANVVTDSMQWVTGADIAFLGGGNIRESIEPGDITMEEVLTVLPFGNLLVTVELPGSEIMKVLEHGISDYPNLTGKHIQIAGLSFTFDPDAPSGQRVRQVAMADGSDLIADRIYTVATNEFISEGGDGYEMMTNGKNLVYYGSDAEALAKYLSEDPAINAEPEWRVRPLTMKETLPVENTEATDTTINHTVKFKKLAKAS